MEPARRKRDKGKAKALPLTRANQGGPLEMAAHREKKTFKVWTRPEYVYIDPNNKKVQRPGLVYDDDGFLTKPDVFQVSLAAFDLQAWKLHPEDDALKAILFERTCIQQARERGTDDPVEAGIKAFKSRIEAMEEKWEKDRKVIEKRWDRWIREARELDKLNEK